MKILKRSKNMRDERFSMIFFFIRREETMNFPNLLTFFSFRQVVLKIWPVLSDMSKNDVFKESFLAQDWKK